MPRLPKNDAVNRFWASVEPYCADITNEDAKVLEDILTTHDEEADYFRVPPLGKHYAEKWAEEDLIEEQREGYIYRKLYLLLLVYVEVLSVM